MKWPEAKAHLGFQRLNEEDWLQKVFFYGGFVI